MVEKMRDRSESKEMQENLKAENEEFLKYLAKNKMTYDEYEGVKKEKDENHLIPDELASGVLSEDGIYNLSLDTQNMAIRKMVLWSI